MAALNARSVSRLVAIGWFLVCSRACEFDGDRAMRCMQNEKSRSRRRSNRMRASSALSKNLLQVQLFERSRSSAEKVAIGAFDGGND
jgi:hypothetical protein